MFGSRANYDRRQPAPPVARTHRDKMALRSRKIHAGLAEIGALPAVVDPERKAKAHDSLLYFLTTYFPGSTGLAPFSDKHLAFIARLENTIRSGGREVAAVFRGFAKTTIGENAVIWATITGRHKFVPLLGVDQPASIANLESIKTELESNDLLLEDYPEVCWPIRHLEGKSQRTHSQTCAGIRTRIRWTGGRIVLPYIPGSLASEAAIETNSLLSCRRGLKHKTSDGTNHRPTFVFVDDPQTDDSAGVEGQVEKRLDKLKKTVLRLAGHNRTISVFIAGTVIATDDFIHQLLDPERYPSWRGERVPMLLERSKAHETFWLGPYAQLRQTYNRDTPDDQLRARRQSLELYQQHRDEADAGARVTWAECYSRDVDAYEISAIQHAYNILIDDGADVFASECQQDPALKAAAIETPTAVNLARKITKHAHRVAPAETEVVTAFIDCQLRVLYYAVVAWWNPFQGHILDYGTYPDQNKDYFKLNQITRTLRRAAPGTDDDAALYAGLDALTQKLQLDIPREDGQTMQLQGGLVDSGYGPHTRTIYEWIRRSPHARLWKASKGRAVGPDERPLSEWKKNPGDRLGEEWHLGARTKNRPELLIYDANYWKTKVNAGLLAPPGSAKAITLYHAHATRHRMIAEQATAERPDTKQGREREVIVWKLPTNKPDNHLGDCIVGAAVRASLEGIRSTVFAAPTKRPRRRPRGPRFSKL